MKSNIKGCILLEYTHSLGSHSLKVYPQKMKIGKLEKIIEICAFPENPTNTNILYSFTTKYFLNFCWYFCIDGHLYSIVIVNTFLIAYPILRFLNKVI